MQWRPQHGAKSSRPEGKALDLKLEGGTIEEEAMFVADVEVDGLDHRDWHIWPIPLRKGQWVSGQGECFELVAPVSDNKSLYLPYQLSKRPARDPLARIFVALIRSHSAMTLYCFWFET
jgi:hypothetical protein